MDTHNEQDDQEELVLRALTHRQKIIERDDSALYRKVAEFDRIGRTIYFFGGLIVATILWVAWVHTHIIAIEKALEERKMVFQHVDEMWWMKEHGVSNRADYYEKHGFGAPTVKESK